MKLFYAPNSPYARKVRVLLAEKGLSFEPVVTDLANPPEAFPRANPNLKVPCLVDGERVLFESNVILDYLLQSYPGAGSGGAQPALAGSLTRPERHWEDLVVLSTIETLLDSGLLLFHMTRDGLDPAQVPSLRREQQRVETELDWLEGRVTPEGFVPGTFSVADLNLAIALLWADFRKPFAWRGRPGLEALVQRCEQRPSLQATQPAG